MPMRSFLGLTLLLTSCADAPNSTPVDCISVQQKFFECMEANSRVIDACIPHSQPAKIAGVWAHDFEHNVFHEEDGLEAHKQDAAPFKRFLAERPRLEGNSEVLWDRLPDRKAVLAEMTFVGRHPLCRPLASPDWILVDKVLEFRVLSEEDEGAITYWTDN